MDSTCRLCSSRSRSSTSIFESKNGKLIADLITIICPITIAISDDLPKKICNLCLRIISEAVELREKSIAIDQNLRRKLTAKSDKKTTKSPEKVNPDPVKLEKESSLINFIDQSLVGHQDFQDYEDNDDDDNADYMDYDQHDSSEIVNYEPPAKIQKRDTSYLKRTIEDDIDGMTDIVELKNVMKTFHKRLIKVESVLNGAEETAEKPVKRGDFLMNKISTVAEFEKFVEDIALSKELREYLVQYWKVIPHGSRQQPENGKVYAILLSLFDEDFLYNQVRWGHGTKKECSKDTQHDESNPKIVVLKTVDHFIDMIKEALGLQSDANSQIATIFKNIFRNKIKRQMIKGINPAEIGQNSQPSIAQGFKEQA